MRRVPWLAQLATVTIRRWRRDQYSTWKVWVTLGIFAASGCTSPTPSAGPDDLDSPARSCRGDRRHGAAEPGAGTDGGARSGRIDPFCAAWAGYAGTLQALGVAASFGELTAGQVAALEVTAAPRLVEVVAAIDGAWPAELESERGMVIDKRIGPYVRRARRGIDALRAAGVTAPDLATLSAAWQASLAGRDPRVAVIVLPSIPQDLQAEIDAAGRAFDSVVTPFAEDPSLSVENVETPATDEYLSRQCPDLASIGVGDAL